MGCCTSGEADKLESQHEKKKIHSNFEPIDLPSAKAFFDKAALILTEAEALREPLDATFKKMEEACDVDALAHSDNPIRDAFKIWLWSLYTTEKDAIPTVTTSHPYITPGKSGFENLTPEQKAFYEPLTAWFNASKESPEKVEKIVKDCAELIQDLEKVAKDAETEAEGKPFQEKLAILKQLGHNSDKLKKNVEKTKKLGEDLKETLKFIVELVKHLEEDLKKVEENGKKCLELKITTPSDIFWKHFIVVEKIHPLWADKAKLEEHRKLDAEAQFKAKEQRKKEHAEEIKKKAEEKAGAPPAAAK